MLSSLPWYRLASIAFVLLALACGCLGADPSIAGVLHPADPLNAAAYDHYYNLEYDAAIQDSRRSWRITRTTRLL